MRRILKISKAAALGDNIGLEHLVFIEGRFSVCGRKCLHLIPPNYSTTLLGWHRWAFTSLSASQQQAWDKPIWNQNLGLDPVAYQAVSSKSSDPCVLCDRSVSECFGFSMLYTDVHSTTWHGLKTMGWNSYLAKFTVEISLGRHRKTISQVPFFYLFYFMVFFPQK